MNNYKDIPQLKNPSCVAIGKFDGIHLGHVSLLEEMVLISELEELESVAITFDPYPEEYFGKASGDRISTKGEIISEMEEIGIETLVRLNFNEELANMSPEDFVLQILVAKLKVSVVVCGEDVSFGKEGKGNLALLNKMGKMYGFRTEVIDKVLYKDEEISSTGIIKALEEGRTEDASNMLGYDYYLYGPVLKGEALGRQFGLPTLNLNPVKGRILPKAGVYASVVEINQKEYNAVTNVGIRPTVSDIGEVNIESHLIDATDLGELYGEHITVFFVKYLREERKFDSKELLFEQIDKDVEIVKRLMK